jgi:hypothetical protein
MIFSACGVQAQTSSRKYNEEENLIRWPTQFDPKAIDFYVHNEITIQASPEVVWQLLIQAGEWNKWYDGIQNIKFENPSQVNLEKNTYVFWNTMGQGLNNQIVEFEPYTTLSWEFNEAKIQGYHAWKIIPIENGCKVITDESQTGKLAKLQKTFVPKKLLKQHDQWLLLLKLEAEKSRDYSSF